MFRKPGSHKSLHCGNLFKDLRVTAGKKHSQWAMTVVKIDRRDQVGGVHWGYKLTESETGGME
jgi:hypothetical protein